MDDVERYDVVTISLHWVSAALIIILFALGETWGFPAHPVHHLMVVAHMSLGLCLTLVFLVRVVWRLSAGHRRFETGPGLAAWAARVVHLALYGLIGVEIVFGFLFRWTHNEALSFFGLLIPSPFAPFSKPTGHLMGTIHNWLAWTIMVLAAGHAVVALAHHYGRRDGVLRRMVPSARR